MLQHVLKAESLKLKHSPIWLAFIILPFISAIMGTLNYYGNRDVLEVEWYGLWTQHTVFYSSLFFPALIAIYCSYTCRLEHLQNNWKNILAQPLKLSVIYMAKLITVCKMVIVTQVVVGVLFFLSGKILGFQTAMPKVLIGYLVYGGLAGTAVAALQLCISLRIKSFAVPIGIGLSGGILGLMLRSKGFALYFPYSLFQAGMCFNAPINGLDYSPIVFSVACIIFMGGCIGVGIKILRKNVL